jgi:hypothetical protein
VNEEAVEKATAAEQAYKDEQKEAVSWICLFIQCFDEATILA